MRIIFILFLFIVQKLIRADDEDEWRYPEKCTGYACDYRVQWWYLEKTDEIKFIISTKFRNKWTGIGFSDGQQMKNTDAVIGLVEDNGRYFLMDTFLSGYQAPPLDAVQNIHNMTVWRENGITHLQFHRFRTTSDPEYDFQFTDDHCAYFHFVVRGGVFNAVNKRMRKHEETPIVSKERICIRSKDPKKHKKIEVQPPSVRFNVPNKPKIPHRFKTRPKLTNLITSTTTTTTTTTQSSIQLFKSTELTTNFKKTADQPSSTLSTDLNNYNSRDKPNEKLTSDKTMEKLNYQINTSASPVDGIKDSATQTTSTSLPAINTESSSVSSLNVDENLSHQSSKLQEHVSNSIETTNSKSETKNDDKLEYGDEDEDTVSSANENLNKKLTTSGNLPSDEKTNTSVDQDGRISTENHAEKTKNAIKSFKFDLKILNNNNAIELNSTAVHQETEKEFNDLTGFQRIKLVTFKSITNNDSKNIDSNKPNSWVIDFEMQVQTDPDTNETDYLAYLQNALNETVNSGHIGNLMLDKSHYALLKRDFNQTKEPEAKYAFEYNFFNQLNIKLTKEELKLAYIALGVSLLVFLVLIQACCMCCTSNKSNKNLHKQNNLSNSSTLQDKHHLKMHHHHAQYNDYVKNCGNNYSYENFALDASDLSPDAAYDMASYKKKSRNSLSKHDPMIYNCNQNYSSSFNRRPDFGYNYNNGNFNNYSNNHHHHNGGYNHGSSSHLRYFEPQPMHSLEPDFYFMPKQRVNHKCYN